MKTPPSHPGHPAQFQGQNSPIPENRRLLKKYSFGFDSNRLPGVASPEREAPPDRFDWSVLDLSWEGPPNLGAGDFLSIDSRSASPDAETMEAANKTSEPTNNAPNRTEPAAFRKRGRAESRNEPATSSLNSEKTRTDDERESPSAVSQPSEKIGGEPEESAPPNPKRVRHNDDPRQVAEARTLHQNNTPLGDIARKFSIQRRTLNRWLGLEDLTEEHKKTVLDLHHQGVPQREIKKRTDLPLPRLIVKLNLKKATPRISEQPAKNLPEQTGNTMSRWGTLLFATAWARKLIQGKNRRERENQTTPQTLAVAGKPSETTNTSVSSRKRKADGLAISPDRMTKHKQTNVTTAPELKKRRLFRANGKAVQLARNSEQSLPVLMLPELEDDLATTPTHGQTVSLNRKPVFFSKKPAPAVVERKTVAPRERSRKGGQFEPRFDQETREKALKLKRQNKTVSQIEKLTGVAQRTLGAWFKQAGLTKPQNVNFKPHDDDKKRQAIELKQQGLHTERISERLNVSPNTLKQWFAAQGLNKERKIYDPAIKNQAMALYRKDMPIPEIASEMDIPVGRIYAWVTESKQANRKKPHSQETRNKVFSLYQDKKTIPAIVSATGVSEATVVKWLKEEGLSNRRKLYDGSVIEQAISRYEKGETRHEISEAMDIPVPTLKKWLVKAGLVNHRQSH